jgi:PAS domain S-box-containing protein
MAKLGSKNKFKSEVRIGLLVIIIVLLGLNVVTNYILYQNRLLKKETVTSKLDSAALTISRNINNEIIPENINTILAKYKAEYNLAGLILTPSAPKDKSKLGQTKWITEIASQFSLSQIPEITRKILESNERTLTKGDNNEYYYVYPLSTATNSRVLILSLNSPELAYLDNASDTIFMISLAVAGVLILIYFLLYRYILSPFRRIKEEAIKAGRKIDDDENDVDVEATISEYQKIITELKDKELELIGLNDRITQKANRLEGLNQYLLESMLAGLIIFDINGNILSINRAAEKLLKINTGEWISKTYKSLEQLNDDLKIAIKKSFSKNLNQPYKEYCCKDQYGIETFLGVIISTIYDEQKKSIGLSLIINDITELKRLQNELEKNERLAALGEMAGGLAHQLRNSLGAILGFSSLILKKFEQNKIDISPAEALQQETKEAESLINKFLNFAKPFDLNITSISLVEILDSLVEKMKIREDMENIDIDLITVLPDNFQISVDQLLIKQALTNILENAAISYNGNKGRVLVKVAECDNRIKINIQDFGCGINQKNIDKIFTPFYSSKPSGNGLGLPLAKKIISLHKGQLTVISKENKGTTFNIQLPLDIEQSTESIKKIAATSL